MGDRTQGLIARLVAVAVVEAFEMIDVEQDNGCRRSAGRELGDTAGQFVVECSAIRQLRQ